MRHRKRDRQVVHTEIEVCPPPDQAPPSCGLAAYNAYITCQYLCTGKWKTNLTITGIYTEWHSVSGKAVDSALNPYSFQMLAEIKRILQRDWNEIGGYLLMLKPSRLSILWIDIRSIPAARAAEEMLC